MKSGGDTLSCTRRLVVSSSWRRIKGCMSNVTQIGFICPYLTQIWFIHASVNFINQTQTGIHCMSTSVTSIFSFLLVVSISVPTLRHSLTPRKVFFFWFWPRFSKTKMTLFHQHCLEQSRTGSVTAHIWTKHSWLSGKKN